MPVEFQKLLQEFELADMSGPGIGENRVVLCRQTGQTFAYSEDGGIDELPEDVDDQEKYVDLPSRKELDLGIRLRLRFAADFMPDDYDEVSDIFRRKGAYRRFRALVERRRVLQAWYDFEKQETDRALREWCKVNGIELAD